MNRTVFHPSFSAALLLVPAVFLTLFSGCYSKNETKHPAEIPVAVRLAKPLVGDVADAYETTGHTDVTPVSISPRVRGTLEEICFEPGAIVGEGDVLFKIEDFDYKIKVDNAKANSYIAKAQFDKAQADYDRQVNMDAKGPGITTKDELERAKALLEESRGKVESARVALDQANKDLERTTIKAPCRGKINKAEPAVGDLIDGTVGTPSVMTTIMSMDPIYVYFQVSDAEFSELHASVLELVKESLGDQYDPTKPIGTKELAQILEAHDIKTPIEFTMRLPSDPEGEYPHRGIITYTENSVDRNTGTITVRGEIENPEYAIFPGQICNVRIVTDMIPNAVRVQEKAVCYDLTDTYIWVLGPDGRPFKQLIEPGKRFEDGTRLIVSGLNGSETYIVDGIQQVRSGCLIQEADADPQAAPAQNTPAAEAPAPESAPAGGQSTPEQNSAE